MKTPKTILRFASIGTAAAIFIAFAVASTVYVEELNTEKSDLSSPLLPYALLFVLGQPIAIGGIAASFCKSTKYVVITWAAIAGAGITFVFIVAQMMLTDPGMFGIPEGYFEE